MKKNNHFRSRIPTDNEYIGMYVFSDMAASKQYEAWRKRYSELASKAMENKAGKTPAELRELSKSGGLSVEERNEMKSLMSLMESYKDKQREKLKSIFRYSQNEDWIGSGQDNNVYTGDIDRSRYVVKYSVDSYVPKVETVEYLRKKYSLLRHFLNNWIPRTHFLLGERRRPFKKKQAAFEQNDNYLSVMTIQQRIQGKTFKDLTTEEKMRPKLLEDLKEAHRSYVNLKQLIKETCKKLDLAEDTLDVKLDVGHLSKEENLEEFDAKKVRFFTSPNIMYDEVKRRIQFIDFDMNDWNPDKELVFQEIAKEYDIKKW